MQLCWSTRLRQITWTAIYFSGTQSLLWSQLCCSARDLVEEGGEGGSRVANRDVGNNLALTMPA